MPFSFAKSRVILAEEIRAAAQVDAEEKDEEKRKQKVNDNNKLAIQMLIAMIAGILAGLLFMALRENLGADSSAWNTVNNILFQDITAAGAESAVGLFYIGGQLFIRALQLIIVPMVAYSLILAINRPIEMLVTSLNCVGDSLTSIAVAKSEGKLNEDVFNQ